MNGSRGREQNFVDSVAPQLRRNAQIRGTLFEAQETLLPQVRLRLALRLLLRSLPVRVGQTRPTPVTGRVILLPQQPDLARMVGQQILARETPGTRNTL